MFSDVAAHADALGEADIAKMPLLTVQQAQWDSEKNILRYTSGNLDTKFAKQVKGIAMSYGRGDLEGALQIFMSHLINDGAFDAWDYWANAVTRDDDTKNRVGLERFLDNDRYQFAMKRDFKKLLP